MLELLNGVSDFRRDAFPAQAGLYRRLARDGQAPRALMVSCSDSRVVPELVTASGPGELFVTRNAGALVPAYTAGGSDAVTAAVEYAVAVLGVRDIVVMGHSDCGAMKGLLAPEKIAALPAVGAWLRHGHAACAVMHAAHPDGLDPAAHAAEMAQASVRAQLDNLRTHPVVARGLARGELELHGWFFDIAAGAVLALDPATGDFETPDLLRGAPTPGGFVPLAAE